MQPTKLPSVSPVKSPRVIVVDDQDWILEIAVQVVRLTLPSAEIVARQDGLEALLAFQQGGADFVVTNHHMPRMGGIELIHELRLYAPDLPIVMISVHPEAKAEALAAGADWFLTKVQIMEFMPGLLLNKIRDFVAPEHFQASVDSLCLGAIPGEDEEPSGPTVPRPTAAPVP